MPRPSPANLSIGDLSHETGLPVETIRMWERRYGSPASVRLPSGHRRYTAADAARLRRVADLVARGVRPSAALRADDTAIDGLPAARAPGDPPVVRACVALAQRLDGDGLAARLDAAASESSPRAFVSRVVAPLLRAIGHGWADGTLNIRHEHLASGVVGACLARLLAAVPPPRRAPAVVFATLPGERHGLGLAMAAVVAAHAGVRCVVLGTDTPLAEIVGAAESARASAVAVSVSLAHRGQATLRDLAALRALLPAGTPLLAGGGGTAGLRRPRPGIVRVDDFAQFEALVTGRSA